MKTNILTSYPKSAELIRSWLLDKIVETGDEIPESFRDDIQLRVDNILETTVEDNPRSLFDLFDKEQIVIVTNFSDDNMFSYKILPRDRGSDTATNNSGIKYKSAERKAIEKFAIRDALKLLENKLNEREKEQERE